MDPSVGQGASGASLGSPARGSPQLYGPAADDVSGHDPYMDEPSSAFIQKTYTMASSPDDDTIVWSDDGQAILVLDIARLERETLPKYFRHNQFKSFVRQLHGYGKPSLSSVQGDGDG